MTWHVSVPIWGENYMRTFERCAAPALIAALSGFDVPVKFVVHTDLPGRVRAALAGYEVDVRPVPKKPTYVTLQESHRDALETAGVGDRVVLLNADLVVSCNFFTRCAAHFCEGKQAVVLLGVRTAASDRRPPINCPPRHLLEWAWEYRHQIIRDLEWGTGCSMLPTNLFFVKDYTVVARGFHLHPAAVVRGESAAFRSTIDGDLLDLYPRESVHVVTDPDDCAMLEVSPPDRRFPVRPSPTTARQVAASMRTRASPTHEWLFTHRIVVQGSKYVEVGDDAVAQTVFEELARAKAHPPPDRRRPQRGRPSR